MNKELSKYFSELGKKGGAKSKRKITPEQQERMQEAKRKKKEKLSNTIKDGFGSEWSKRCPGCGKDTMQVVRPGKAQCTNCA